nr:hypothetical protein pmam_313 [Pithovirus mammoth]
MDEVFEFSVRLCKNSSLPISLPFCPDLRIDATFLRNEIGLEMNTSEGQIFVWPNDEEKRRWSLIVTSSFCYVFSGRKFDGEKLTISVQRVRRPNSKNYYDSIF